MYVFIYIYIYIYIYIHIYIDTYTCTYAYTHTQLKWIWFNNSFNGWIDKNSVKMSGHFLKLNSLETYVKVELDLSNYATKTDLQNAAGVDT